MPTAMGYPEYWIVAAVIVVVSSTVWPPLSLLLMSGAAIFWLFRRGTNNRIKTIHDLSSRKLIANCLGNYDAILHFATLQHTITKEAIHNQLDFGQLSGRIVPVGSMFDGIYIPEFSALSNMDIQPTELPGTDDTAIYHMPDVINRRGALAQELDIMVVLPHVTASENSASPVQIIFQDNVSQVYVKLKVNDISKIELRDNPYLEPRRGLPRFLSSLETIGSLFLNNYFPIVFRDRMLYVLDFAFGGNSQISLIKVKTPSDFYPVITFRFKQNPHDIWPDFESNGGSFQAWPDQEIVEIFKNWVWIISRGQSFWLDKIIDLAPAIAAEWPLVFREEWLNRSRTWPDEQTVQLIPTLPCHVLSKPPETMDKSAKTLQWRFGFNNAESVLCRKFSHKYRKMIMLLKAIRRKYMETPKVLVSYHIKTVSFRFLEQRSEEKVAAMNPAQILDGLLELLITALQKKSLPSFFVKTHNLLYDADPGDVDVTLKMLKRIRQNMSLYLTEDLFDATSLDREDQEFSPVQIGVEWYAV